MTDFAKLLAECKAARVAHKKHQDTGKQGYGFTKTPTHFEVCLTTKETER